ncbi:Wadjet anti-phage system protein JetA family protein [Thiohalorhabdus methylotrophus]|uniref:Wadjet anti-phage system protein JetA family protein n=1 Tax=Thiohalorhabdus methylotrophus TaxID=3242694 RepID=A0ABV4TUK5_9GAMM
MLQGLYADLLENSDFTTYPPREEVKHVIEKHLRRHQVELLREAEDETESPDTPDGKAGYVYRRLKDSGWLSEVSQGYQVSVTIPPDVGVVLETLVGVASPKPMYYGGKIQNILTVVHSVYADPGGNGQGPALHHAVEDAQGFKAHLTRMVYGLSEQFKRFQEEADPKVLLANFFGEFIENFLIADYKDLKTENNPFRYRHRIVEAVREIRYDTGKWATLCQSYLDQMHLGSIEEAEHKLRKDLDTLAISLERVDEEIEHLERVRSRFERRAADVIRYMDRAEAGGAGKVLEWAHTFVVATTDWDEHEEVDLGIPLIGEAPFGDRQLHEPSEPRTPNEPDPIVTPEPDPIEEEFQRQMKAFTDRRTVGPRKLRTFLDEQVPATGYIEGEELRRDSVEDLMAFEAVPLLAGSAPFSPEVARQFEVEVDGQRMVNYGPVVAPHFRVRRRREV